MKALGKGSLASILAAGLHIVRVVIFVAFAGLAIAAVMLPLGPALLELASRVEGVNVESDLVIEGGDYIRLVYYFVTFGVMLYIVNRLLEILRTLRFGSPFVKENAVRFRRVGYALLFGEAAKLFFGFFSLVSGAEIDVKIELIAWIGIAAVFVLAEVFHEGARMKEEQDLTV
ncbi:DUF2975 domain-containing protein [Amphiplicatus metriothermophilus]|uniref:DUF2975 domain-containing protein n=1 Tax=Amphiplicatus metriothermophilus TaxID=1519374 RepID=A0A239PJU6_9PROT|nr:DUF2975 domain-containing protein [Amphiplicatus metriothermophilus]MBB5517585.1 hypothetical protein [Amphiplicatus metriothermophilus]SNT68081.1 Protein of unknown function [Amphiplicatus metriothermophilus]